MPGEITAALCAELLKVRRSLVPWVTMGAITLAGLVGAFFMFVLQDVSRAKSLGLLGTKAQLTGGSAAWPGYFSLTAQTGSVGGLMIFGMIVIWLFGREFSDRTAQDLLALPTSRTSVVLAKLLLALAWCLLLLALLILLTLFFGTLLGLPGWSAANVLRGAGTVLLTGGLTAGLTTTYGLVASIGRGYLPAIATMFLTLLVAQVIAAVGYGAWFPWSVPSLIAGAAGPDHDQPGLAGITSVALVAVASVTATLAWWERADHAS